MATAAHSACYWWCYLSQWKGKIQEYNDDHKKKKKKNKRGKKEKKQTKKSNAYTSLYGLDYLSMTYKCYLVGTSWLCMLALHVQLKQKSFLIYEDSVLDIPGREHSSFYQWCEMSVWAGKCHEAWSDELPSFLPGFIMHSGFMLHCVYLCPCTNLVRKYLKK